MMLESKYVHEHKCAKKGMTVVVYTETVTAEDGELQTVVVGEKKVPYCTEAEMDLHLVEEREV